MDPRKVSRPMLVIGAITVGVLGWTFFRPGGGEVFVPFPEAGIPDAAIDADIDAAIDAAIDAPIDSPPGEPPPMADPWERITLAGESITGFTLTGADGVAAADLNGDGNMDFTVGWEQSGKSTVSIHPGCATGGSTWALGQTVTLPVSTTGVEDATFGDVDGDGRTDVISSGSSGFRVYVHFAPSSNSDLLTSAQWTGISITASVNNQRFLKAIVYDFDNDGHNDIIAGGYSTGATLDLYESTTPRTAASWTLEEIGTVGALYALEKRDMDGDGDMDIVITDRDGAGALKGVRWVGNPLVGGGSWTSHSIYQIGNTRWMGISSNGKTIVGGTSATTGSSTTWILTCAEANPSACNPVGGASPAWTKTDITQPTNIGLYNAARLYDIDIDGDDDIVLTYHHASGDLSNVIWMRNDGGGTYTRGEISGPDGVKSDNFELADVDCDGDMDVITTDEGVRGSSTVTPLGLTAHLNPYGVL